MAVNNYLDNSELAERIFIANGNVFKTSFVHKFGAVNAMSQNNYGTIWDVDDTLYPWTSLDAGPLVLDVVPANTADIEKSVTIEGLNENWEFVREVVTTDSSITPRGTSVNQFRRIFRAYVTDTVFADDVDIERAGTVVARIRVSKAQTLMAVYTIPANYTGFLTQGTTSIQAGGDATVDMFVRYGGEVDFRIGHSVEITGTGGPYVYPFTIPLKLPEKTDIDIRAQVRSNNARVTAAFDLVLVRNR